MKGLMCKLFANRTTIATASQQIRALQANLTRCLHNISLCYANVLKLASRWGCGCGGRCWWLGGSTLLKSFLCRCMSAGKTAWALSHHYQMPPPLTTSSVTYIRTYVRISLPHMTCRTRCHNSVCATVQYVHFCTCSLDLQYIRNIYA